MYPSWQKYVCIINSIPIVSCSFDFTAVAVTGKVVPFKPGLTTPVGLFLLLQLTVLSQSAIVVYEGPSKGSVMNGSPCARRGYASLILCIHIRHSIIHPYLKLQMNQANIYKVMCIPNSPSHILWPLFEDEKEESVEIGGVNSKKKSCCVDTFATKRDMKQKYEYNA